MGENLGKEKVVVLNRTHQSMSLVLVGGHNQRCEIFEKKRGDGN